MPISQSTDRLSRCERGEAISDRQRFVSTRLPHRAMRSRNDILVLRRIHKIRKTGGRRIVPVVLLFLLFLYEIISQRHRVLRGNPGPPAVRRLGKQRDHTLFFALFPSFSWSRHRKYTNGSAIGSGPGEGIWVSRLYHRLQILSISQIWLLPHPRRSVVRSRCWWPLNRSFESPH